MSNQNDPHEHTAQLSNANTGGDHTMHNNGADNSDVSSTESLPQSTHPQPKEGKPRTSWIKTGILLPGAILAGIFLLIATAIGIGKLFGSAKKKRPKSTQLDA